MFKRAMQLTRYVGNLLLNVVYLVACLTPRDKRLWLFGAWGGGRYLDNPKYIYRHVLNACPDIRAVWVVKDKTLHLSMREMGLPSVYAFSVAGILHQLRAGVVVFTHAPYSEYLPCLIGSGVKKIQTWHGMPIKKIGNDDVKNLRCNRTINLLYSLTPFMAERFDLVIAGSEADKSKYVSAFGVSQSNVVITGYPRNDELLVSVRRGGSAASGVKIIYMPTFRGDVGSEFNLLGSSNFDFDKVDSLLKQLGVDFFIKLHPVQVFSKSDICAIKRCTNIHLVENKGDIYESIGAFDMLVTDFSGIYFDYLVTGKPIVMAPIDMDGYIEKDRELYYSYDDICPDEPCCTWDRVFQRISDILEGRYDYERYRRLQTRFHRYIDSESSARVVAEIRKVVGAGM